MEKIREEEGFSHVHINTQKSTVERIINKRKHEAAKIGNGKISPIFKDCLPTEITR